MKRPDVAVRPRRSRRTSHHAALAVTSLGLALAAACSDGMQVGSVHVKSGQIGPAGGALTITAADHLQLAGTSIVFPAGALARDSPVAIGFSDASLVLDDARAAGPALYFEPVGLALGGAASVTVPFDKSVGASSLKLRVHTGDAVSDVTERITAVDEAAALITFELDRLGHTQPQAIFLLPPDAGCNAPQCPPSDGGVDAGCALGACPIDGGTPIDAPPPPPPQCPLFCTVGTMCTPATGTCQAICGNQICPQGQGCNGQNQCVAQCGMGGAITFLCPPQQVCNFANGTCHQP